MKAEDYSHLPATGRRLVAGFRQAIVDRAVAARPDSVLEVGCGQGWLTSRLLEALPDASITGLDIREDAVTFARDLCPTATFLVANGERLPFDDRTFDLIVCSEVLEHVTDPSQVLREITRVGRGRAVLSVPHEPWFWAANLVRGTHLRTFGNCPGHIHHWSRAGFRRMLLGHFDDVEVIARFPWLVADVAENSAPHLHSDERTRKDHNPRRV